MVIVLRRTLDDCSNATAIHATYAISDKYNPVRIARIAGMQVAIALFKVGM